MKYPILSEEELRATTEQAAETFGDEASSAFQLCSTTAVTVRGIILVHDADSDEFYLLGEYKGIGFGEASVKVDATPIRCIGDFEDCA
jgi:hypothetical protein